MRNLLRKGTLLGAAGAMAVVTACSSDSKDTADSRPAPAPAAEEAQQEEASVPAISEDEALEVIANYSEGNNRVYRELDPAILQEIEGGSLLQRSEADLERHIARSKSDRATIEDWEYVDPQLYIPAGDGERWWMASVGTVPDDGGLRLLTFAENPEVEGQWLLVSAINLEAELPSIALDEHGLAQPVPADDPGGQLLPRDAAAAYEDLWATGGDGLGAALADTPGGQDILERRRTADPLLLARYTPNTPQHEEVWSLRTEDGGVLTVATVAHSETLTDVRGELLTPSEVSSHYNAQPRNPIVTHHTGEALMWLPAGDTPQILGARWNMIDAE
ncbi:hypothetical protein ACFVUW_11235 [Streptomyces xiamenensis]|uniref:hypothetical protein n=1 Tax=Streptomyces xiamenensis TaxID=408015 RepID=UPI0036EDF1D7